jgi:hypothetical protein
MNLPDDSRIWIFGISPSLDEARGARLLARVDRFLSTWAAHGEPITSGRDLLEGSFLIIGVDKRSETSGCSIDRMFGLLQELERDLSVKILDPDRIFYRGADGKVHAITRAQFRESGDPHTRVFDILTERLGDIRSGHWERAAKDSWHRSLLKTPVSA